MNGQQLQQPKCTMKILLILPMIILTAIIALLYNRSDQTFLKTSISAKKLYHIANNELIAENIDEINDPTGQNYEIKTHTSVSKLTSAVTEETNRKSDSSLEDYNIDSNNHNKNNETKYFPYESRMYQTDKRLLNHDDYSKIGVEHLSKKDASIGYQNPYDLTTNVHSYKGNQIPIYGTGWTTVDQPEQWHYDDSSPSKISVHGSSWDRPSYVLENYKSSADPSIALTKEIYNKINFRKIGILALIKFGLIKLQAIGFLNIVFLLGLKLKIFIIAIFFKFFLLLKSIKFLNILSLPLLILQLLPAFMQLLSMAQQIIEMIRRSSPESNFQSNQSSILRPGTIFGNRIPSTITGTTVPGGNMLNNIPGMSTGNSNTIPPQNTGTRMSDSISDTYILNSKIGNSISAETGISDFKLDNNILNVRHNESFKLFESSLNILEKVLNSEKCIERIACRISAAEKFGILPFWINWVFYYHVSKFIPNDKLEVYFKIYKDVNNEVYTKLSTTDNWEKWCIERYVCNSDKKSITIDTN